MPLATWATKDAGSGPGLPLTTFWDGSSTEHGNPKNTEFSDQVSHSHIYRQGNHTESGATRRGLGLGVGTLEGSGGSCRRVGSFPLLTDVPDTLLGSRKSAMQRMLPSSADVTGKSLKVNLRAMGATEEYRAEERPCWTCV